MSILTLSGKVQNPPLPSAAKIVFNTWQVIEPAHEMAEDSTASSVAAGQHLCYSRAIINCPTLCLAYVAVHGLLLSRGTSNLYLLCFYCV